MAYSELSRLYDELKQASNAEQVGIISERIKDEKRRIQKAEDQTAEGEKAAISQLEEARVNNKILQDTHDTLETMQENFQNFSKENRRFTVVMLIITSVTMLVSIASLILMLLNK